MIFKKYAEIKKDLQENKITSVDLCKAYLKRIEENDSKIKAFLYLNKDRILQEAASSDERRKAGKALSDMDGIPIGIKDNICIKGERVSCGSGILENFVSPYDATAIQKLRDKGFIFFPGLNMDEFAMGSSTAPAYAETHGFGTMLKPR